MCSPSFPERLPSVINNYWMSPETTSVNRLPMLNIEHFEQISLDGTWRFQLLHSPTEKLGKRWASIPVPGGLTFKTSLIKLNVKTSDSDFN